MKRKTLVCALCAVLVVGMLALVGCGSSSTSGNSGSSSGTSDQEAISKDLSSQLDAFKNSGSQAFAEELKAYDSMFKTLGIDSGEFAKELLNGFTYSIGTITVDSEKGSAIAEVKITSKTVGSVLVAVVNTIPSAVTTLTADDLSSENTINTFIGNQLMQAVKSAGTEDTALTLTYTKTGDTWKMDDLETQLYKALGLDTISLDSIYSYLGVSNSSELANYLNQFLAK